jgi:hypothetical protein
MSAGSADFNSIGFRLSPSAGLNQRATRRFWGPASRHRATPQRRIVAFGRVNSAAFAALPRLLERWLPGGRIEGREYVVRNPSRHDQRPGSFKVNLNTGRWADFATGDKGGDPISLGAYLAGCSQVEAARQLAIMLGLPAGG